MTESEWLASDDPVRMLRWRTDEHQHQVGPTAGCMPSDRKLRLFACACYLAFGAFEPCYRLAIESDGERDEWRMAPVGLARAWCRAPEHASQKAVLLRDIAGNPFRPVELCGPAINDVDRCHHIRTWQGGTVVELARAAYEERRRKCLQCSRWPSSFVSVMPCQTCHGIGCIENGTLDSERLLVLADALEEAGCEEEEILRHLRGWVRCPHCEGQGGFAEWHPTTMPGLLFKDETGCAICRGTGWLRTDAPHVRGCWVLDLVLERE